MTCREVRAKISASMHCIVLVCRLLPEEMAYSTCASVLEDGLDVDVYVLVCIRRDWGPRPYSTLRFSGTAFDAGD